MLPLSFLDVLGEPKCEIIYIVYISHCYHIWQQPLRVAEGAVVQGLVMRAAGTVERIKTISETEETATEQVCSPSPMTPRARNC
jgi:hypothetical protein